MKIFLKHNELIEKLETRAGISFSPSILKLYNDKGYVRVKKTLIFMKQNNIEINNRSIGYIYRADKHLRHTLMPRIETFEMKLKNHMLHVITSVAKDGLVFDSRTTKRVYIKGSKLNKFKKSLNHSLTRAFLKEYDVDGKESYIFDWIHKMMLGEVIQLFNLLQEKFKNEIFENAFGIKVNHDTVKKDLDKLRKLRNKIAHAEQLFSPKNSSCVTNSKSENNYVLALKQNIKKSSIKDALSPVLKFIDEHLDILNRNTIK